MTERNLRQFIRHPMDIPIEVNSGDEALAATEHTHNLSLGGLAFRSAAALECGALVEICIAFVQPPFRGKARVAWCSAGAQGCEVGVEFLDPEAAFLARMVEQVCHIETYKQTVYRSEGRLLSAEQAAMEWIGKYAAQFPSIGPEGVQ